jgi:hypothetical protein
VVKPHIGYGLAHEPHDMPGIRIDAGDESRLRTMRRVRFGASLGLAAGGLVMVWERFLPGDVSGPGGPYVFYLAAVVFWGTAVWSWLNGGRLMGRYPTRAEVDKTQLTVHTRDGRAITVAWDDPKLELDLWYALGPTRSPVRVSLSSRVRGRFLPVPLTQVGAEAFEAEASGHALQRSEDQIGKVPYQWRIIRFRATGRAPAGAPEA